MANGSNLFFKQIGIPYNCLWSLCELLFYSQTLPVEYMGKKPLCMAQYFKILSSCRIPGEKKDSVVTFPPDKPNPPRHIIVMHNNRVQLSTLLYACKLYVKYYPNFIWSVYNTDVKLIMWSRVVYKMYYNTYICSP